jgi:hypothetical protein
VTTAAEVLIPLFIYLGIGFALSVSILRMKPFSVLNPPKMEDYFWRGLGCLLMAISWPLSAGLIALGKVSHSRVN